MSAALLLRRVDVERLLTPEACIAAVEDASRALALGKVAAPNLLGLYGAAEGFGLRLQPSRTSLARRRLHEASDDSTFDRDVGRGRG
jgi:hypothetical protein